MEKLVAFIFRYRVFLVYVGLEVVCFTLIFSKNDYQRVVFLNSSSAVVGSISEKKSVVKNYFNLENQNGNIASQNAELKEKIIRNNALFKYTSRENPTISSDKYRLYPAKIVNNSIHYQNNYITLNVGSSDGMEVGFGVISESGLVGSIISCSKNYSLAVSVLHSQTMISSKIKRSGNLGTVIWNGKESKGFSLKYIPRHVNLIKGDTIVTSGYNAVYPEGQIIGVVSSFELLPNNSFYDIDVKLSGDMSQLDYVYVVENIGKLEQTELEKTVND